MLVFVYGTLKRNYWNNFYMEQQGAEFLGDAKTVFPLFKMWDLNGIPGVVGGWGNHGGSHVIGEMWDVKDITPIDHLEGHPNVYHRQKTSVQLIDGPGLLLNYMYILRDRFVNPDIHFEFVPDQANCLTWDPGP